VGIASLATNSNFRKGIGMGGSSGGGYRLGDSKALEEKAKQILQSGQGKKNVFISFSHDDLGEVNLLRGQAGNENSDINFKDFSVQEPYNSERAEYIKSKIADRINMSSTTVVYITENTLKSEWVAWEVSKSIELGKRVIGVHKGTIAPTMPSWVKQFGVKVVSWSSLKNEL
jgi:hypothetical protein